MSSDNINQSKSQKQLVTAFSLKPMYSNGFLRDGLCHHEPQSVARVTLPNLQNFFHAPGEYRLNLLKLVYAQRIESRYWDGEEIAKTWTPSWLSLFLILKDRVIRERVRNLEQQRKEKRRKREREAR